MLIPFALFILTPAILLFARAYWSVSWRWVLLLIIAISHFTMAWMAFADGNPNGPGVIFSLWFGWAIGLVYSMPWLAIYFLCSLVIQSRRRHTDDYREACP